jgi:hypothetical protein
MVHGIGTIEEYQV